MWVADKSLTRDKKVSICKTCSKLIGCCEEVPSHICCITVPSGSINNSRHGEIDVSVVNKLREGSLALEICWLQFHKHKVRQT